MKTFILILCVFISSLVFSQSDTYRPKLRIYPHFGIGWAFPPSIDPQNSGLVLEKKILRNYVIGDIITSSGQTKSIYKMTNSIGLDFNYQIAKRWSVNLGLNRAMQVNILNDPDPIRLSNNTEYTIWIYAYKYSSIALGFRYNRFDKFFQLNSHVANIAQEAITNDNSSGSGVITNGNGLSSTTLALKNKTFIIAPEFGVTGVSSFDLPMELSVGAYIPTSFFLKQEATFFRNNSPAGTNLLKFNQGALWIKVKVPITLWTRSARKPKLEVVSKANLPKVIEYEGRKVSTGEKVVLRNIQFEQGKSALSTTAMAELDRIEDLMNQSSSMIIEIIGHTSDEGDRNSNIELSLIRAKACKEYLVKNGIKANRIQVRGMGPDQPISKIDKSLNRRVEMQIIRM
ncbi:OmpA family protein [Emticicia oligotrophica]|uniref:OmpA family protein n=1 Tax=Emticicia oligotrophica TaxID=312279 RepID=UPI0002E5B868|nr:OmpA family protein [Emticicia oligotrophica]